MILIDVACEVRIDDVRDEFVDSLLDRADHVKKRHRVKTLIGQVAEDHVVDAEDRAGLLSALLLLFLPLVPGPHTVREDVHRNVVSLIDMPDDGAPSPQGFIIWVATDYQNSHVASFLIVV